MRASRASHSWTVPALLAAATAGCSAAADEAFDTTHDALTIAAPDALRLPRPIPLPAPKPTPIPDVTWTFHTRDQCAVAAYKQPVGGTASTSTGVPVPAIADGDACIETGHAGATSGTVYVDVDNPRVWLQQTLPTTAGLSPRLYSDANGWLAVDSDYALRMQGALAFPDAGGMPQRGLVTGADGVTHTWVALGAGEFDGTLLPWPAVTGSYGGGNPMTVTLVAQGARVGFLTAMTPELVRQDRNGDKGYFGPYAVELDPQIVLVPVQTLVVSSPSYAQHQAYYGRAGQLALWDRLPTVGSTQGPPDAIRRDWQQDTWIATRYARGSYGMFWEPDDLWVRCGVQFRLATHNEVQTDDAHVNARLSSPPRAAAIDNVTAFARSTAYVPGMPVVLFMDWCAGDVRDFAGTLADGTPYVCVSTEVSRFNIPPLGLAWQLGTALGVGDPGTYCGTDPDNLFCGGKAATITDAQCTVARNHGLPLQQRFMPVARTVPGPILGH